MSGILFGIGVGPGDPELITLKALNVLKKIDVIITPITEKKSKSRALEIVNKYLKEDIKIIYQTFPMVFDENNLNKAWINNKNEILEILNKNKNVGFITLGDPMIYSTFIYIYKLLKNHKIKIEIIPGVTSFCDIASRTGFVLVENKEILNIIPATVEDSSIDDNLKSGKTVVLMKVYKNFKEVINKLKKFGYSKKAVLATKIGMENEEIIYDIENIDKKKINYLSTIIAKKIDQ